MQELKILKDAVHVKFSDWVEWKLKYFPHVVTIVSGNDYTLIVSQATSSNSYDSTWPHTWIDDIATTRTPLLAFRLTFSSKLTQPQSWYGLYGFSILFWIQLVATQLIICLFAALPIAILMYYIIIIPQKRDNEQQAHKTMTTDKKQVNTGRSGTSTLGYIFGWFVLLPIWIAIPSPLATAFGMENSIHRFFACGTTPTIAIFRTLEAMYGFAPSHSITSVYSYALYFTSP